MDRDLQFIQELIDAICNVQVHLVPNTQAGMQELLHTLSRDTGAREAAEQAMLRALRAIAPGCIYEISSILGLKYAAYCQEKPGRLLILGPCREEAFSEKETVQYLRRERVPEEKIRDALAFCRQQPELSSDKLYRVMELLARRLLGTGDVVAYRRLDAYWQVADQKEILISGVFEGVEHIRQIESRYEASAVMTEAVKQGNLSLAYRLIGKMGSIPEDLNRNANPLRNAQNLCIILNTQLRHALEENGVQPYRLDQISGGIARQIEKLKTAAQVNAYFGEILRQYCALAREEECRALGPFARMAITYIQSHLSDNITVQEAAKALLVNPDYLSAQFHREVGMPFITYVNRERTRQAAALLKRTELQVQQIASAVGYNNTSYFARQFLKYQGCTPRAYRKQG